MDPFQHLGGNAGGELSECLVLFLDLAVLAGRGREGVGHRGRGWLQVFLQDVLPAAARLLSIISDLKDILFSDN